MLRILCFGNLVPGRIVWNIFVQHSDSDCWKWKFCFNILNPKYCCTIFGIQNIENWCNFLRGSAAVMSYIEEEMEQRVDFWESWEILYFSNRSFFTSNGAASGLLRKSRDLCFRVNWFVLGTAQEWTNRTLISHERTSVHFLVLPGSLLSFTEITEHTYISLL